MKLNTIIEINLLNIKDSILEEKILSYKTIKNSILAYENINIPIKLE